MELLDSRPPDFAEQTNRVLAALGFPCRASLSSGGLGMFATRRIRRGEELAREAPLTMTVVRAAAEHTCAVCLADSRAAAAAPRWARACAGCGGVRFCSAACEAAAAAAHAGAECAARAALASTGATCDDGDLLAQAVRLLAHRAAARRAEVLPGLWGAYESYAARLVGVARRVALAHTAAPIRDVVDACLGALPGEARVPREELFDVLNRHQCNVYAVLGREADELASASFVGVLHLFNHACNPNAAFDCKPRGAVHGDGSPREAEGGAGPYFSLVALRDVEEGEELCVAYTSTADGPSERQEHLRNHYGFDCACERCSCNDPMREIEIGEAFDNMRCVYDDCGTGYAVPTADHRLRCLHCDRSWSDDEDEP
ncbi:hypothetical protein AB1Y20_002931 [Prymnesium parvum]|uniref:SET domain-containing protein n=1 Tax=Prymnesium parvum TaxID=97485 RepID=A0AB34JAZ4_PRYPA